LAAPVTTAVVLFARFLAALAEPIVGTLGSDSTLAVVFFLGFVGVRGVVSLTAALAIPLTTVSGAPFPDRDLILFVTFGLIVITLVG
jgi:NhaP-type Na+/H+ or K+/H+ antiporter